MEKNNRTYSVDIAKGILIILVVVAHAQTDIVHDIIFMFHMPLFFMISGFIMGREKLLKTGYESDKIKHLMIPYIIYLVLDMVSIPLSEVHAICYRSPHNPLKKSIFFKS